LFDHSLISKRSAAIDSSIDACNSQNVYGESWWEERVDAVTRAVEAVSAAAQNAENVEKDQPESFSNKGLGAPFGAQRETKIASC